MASREARTGAPEEAETVVLVVDDEPDVASVTATYLDRHLDEVAIAVESGGDEAITRLGGDIDCVVSDYEMPGLDGLELLRHIRDRTPELPFILFTARGSEEIASEAISAGVTDYLQKGVGTDQYAVLANRIENAIARRRTEEAAAETETRYQRLLESSPHAVAVLDDGGLRFVNDRFREVVAARTIEDVFDRDPLELIHPEDREVLVDRMGRVLGGDALTEWSEWRLRRFDDVVRHVESRAAPVRFEGRAAAQVVLRDLTERRSHERQIRALHDATRRLVTAEEPGEVGDIALETIRDVFNEPIAGLWAFDAAAGELVAVSLTKSTRRLARENGHDSDELSLPDWTAEMNVFEAGEPRAITDYGDRDDAINGALEAVLMYPIDRHGLLTIGSTDPDRTFDDSQQDLVGILARSVAAAMDRVGADTGNH